MRVFQRLARWKVTKNTLSKSALSPCGEKGKGIHVYLSMDLHYLWKAQKKLIKTSCYQG